MNAKDIAFYLDVLDSWECQCGRTKRPRKAFCWKCYSALPRHMQQDLFQRIGDGFEAAYEAAVDWLN